VGLLFYGDPGVERGVIGTAWNHVSPRLGFAWDPFGDGKTSVRAAAGLFYGSISGNEWNTMTNYQPWATRLSFSNTSTKTTSAGVPLGASLSNPYNNYVGGVPFPYNGRFINGGGIFGVALDFKWSHAYQTNVSIQREIGRVSVGAAYVGTYSRNLPFGRDVNYPVVTADATASGASVLARRPNPAYGAVLLIDSDQYANYNGLQLTFGMRPWHRVSFNGFYALTKTMTSAQVQNNTTQGGAQNSSRLSAEYGRGDTDQRHVFSMSLNWDIDYYRGSNALLRHLLNGWAISPIIKVRSGLPFTVTNNNVDANLDGNNATDRAQLVGDPHLDNPSAALWFNTAAFAQNKVVTGVAVDGNSPRNFLNGPGYRVVDLALSREFPSPRKARLTIRAEATNALNIVSLGLPGATVPSGTTSATFGIIRSANPMRRLQLGARVTF
jgi:hypothetical protein